MDAKMHFIVMEKNALEDYITKRLVADGEAYVKSMQELREGLVQDAKTCRFEQTAVMLAGMIAGLDAAIEIAHGGGRDDATRGL